MDKIKINYNDKDVILNVYSSDETISNIIRGHKNFFEINFLTYIYKNHQNQKNIIDIGANIGNHSLFFSEFIKHDKIYCFEPYYENVEILKENMKDKNCEIFDVALSDVNGEKILYNSQKGNNGGFSLECYTVDTPSYKVLDSVNVRTLDSYNLDNVTMIKIDVESHELQVLNGSVDTINRNKPIIFLENLGYFYPHRFQINKFDEFFEKINYKKDKGNDTLGSMMDLWIPI